MRLKVDRNRPDKTRLRRALYKYPAGMLTRPQPHEAEATIHEAEATTHETETEADAEAEATTHDNAKNVIILGWVTHASIDAIFVDK